MEALSLHFCFQLVEDPLASEGCLSLFQQLPGTCLGEVGPTSEVNTGSGDRILVGSSPNGSHVVIHIYKHGLVTMDVQFVGKPPYSRDLIRAIKFPNIKRIENEIKRLFGQKCKYTRNIPARIKLGETCPYFLHGNETLFEFENSIRLLFEVNSKWQNIKIYKTESYGAMLVFDGEFMIAESDDIYNQTLLGTERHSYLDKTVLILGGGDGGLLNQLRKLSPKHVLMVENIEVINACQKHMKRMCSDSLDHLEGPNYKIRIEDCQKVLNECVDSGRKFDFVINDLSEFLLNTDISYDYDFVASTGILESSLRVMSEGGKYLSRGGCLTDQEYLSALEKDITSNPEGLTFQQFVIDVPSYNEKYCIYEVRRNQPNA